MNDPFFECVTVLEYCFTQSWVEGSKFKKISTNIDDLNVNNLDDNVLFYAKNGKPKLIKKKRIF